MEHRDRIHPSPSAYGGASRAGLLAAAVEHILATMIERELVEVSPLNRDDALDAMIATASDAGSLPDMARRIVRVLDESPDVEEIYGTDEMLHELILEALDAR
jgi:hypothetical protein